MFPTRSWGSWCSGRWGTGPGSRPGCPTKAHGRTSLSSSVSGQPCKDVVQGALVLPRGRLDSAFSFKK